MNQNCLNNLIGKMKQKMPDPDGSKLADTVIAEYYQRSNAQTIQLCGFDESLSYVNEQIRSRGEICARERMAVC